VVTVLAEQNLRSHKSIVKSLVREFFLGSFSASGRSTTASFARRSLSSTLPGDIILKVVIQAQENIGSVLDEAKVVYFSDTTGVAELDSLAVARDEKLLGLEASEDDRNVMDFSNNLQE
jgi:hypothetical protein